MYTITSMRTGVATRDWNDAFTWQNADPDCEECKGTGMVSKTFMVSGCEQDSDTQPCPHCFEVRP